MNLQALRQRVIGTLQDLKRRQPLAHIHLVYSPEYADTLELVGDTRRDTGFIRPLSGSQLPPEQAPRFLTLDCRRVAPYLFASDTALDDPLLEASITRAQLEMESAASPSPAFSTVEAPTWSVCGWIVSPDDAGTIAARFARRGRRFIPALRRMAMMRLYDPRVLLHLWPLFDDAQRPALLGEHLHWIAIGWHGELHTLTTGTHPADTRFAGTEPIAFLRDERQQQYADNAGLVNDTMVQWRRMLPLSQRHRPVRELDFLHALVQDAQQLRLDGEDLRFCLHIGLQLRPGSLADPEFVQMTQHQVAAGSSVRDGVPALSPAFWDRYRPGSPALESAATAA